MKTIVLLSLLSASHAFAPQGLQTIPKSRVSEIYAIKDDESVVQKSDLMDWKVATTTLMLGCSIIGSAISFPGSALADEYGRETEAPTLFTGETTMVRFGETKLSTAHKTIHQY